MTVKEKVGNRAIQSSISILQSLKIMDKVKVKMLFVFDENRFLNLFFKEFI